MELQALSRLPLSRPELSALRWDTWYFRHPHPPALNTVEHPYPNMAALIASDCRGLRNALVVLLLRSACFLAGVRTFLDQEPGVAP